MRLLLFAFVLSSMTTYAQATFKIEMPTDTTYRIDVIEQNEDGVQYVVPGIEVDSTTLISTALKAIERSFEVEGIRERQAIVNNLNARRLANELNKTMSVNYFAENDLHELFQGKWVFVYSGKREVFTLTNRRFFDTKKIDNAVRPVVRFKSRTTFETIGINGVDNVNDKEGLLLTWYLDQSSARPRFVSEIDGKRAFLIYLQ